MFPSPALREKVPKADEGLLERQLKIALTLALSRKRERGNGGCCEIALTPALSPQAGEGKRRLEAPIERKDRRVPDFVRAGPVLAITPVIEIL